MSKIQIIFKSIKEVMRNKNDVTIFSVASLIFLMLFISIPVFTIPGNSLLFQLEIFTFWNYVLMILLSVLIGLMTSMQIYAYKIKKSVRGVGRGVVGGFSSIMAGLFGTASCASCLTVVFGFLGIGTVFFLIKYQWFIVGISLFLIIISIYFTSLSIEKNCGVCK